MSDGFQHACYLVAMVVPREARSRDCESGCLLFADPGATTTHVELLVTAPCGGGNCKFDDPAYVINHGFDEDVGHRKGITHRISYNVRRSVGETLWKPKCCWRDPNAIERWWNSGGVARFIDRKYERGDRQMMIRLRLEPNVASEVFRFCERQGFTTPDCRESDYNYCGFACMPFSRMLRAAARCLGPFAGCFCCCGEGRYPVVETRTHKWTCAEFVASALAAAGAIELDVPACLISPHYLMQLVQNTPGLSTVSAKSHALSDATPPESDGEYGIGSDDGEDEA